MDLSALTAYPVGLTFDAAYEAFSVRQTVLSEGTLQFSIPEGPFARTETVAFVADAIRPGVFLVSWQERSGATVIHVEDLVKRVVHSHATLPDGTFLRMKAPIQLATREDLR